MCKGLARNDAREAATLFHLKKILTALALPPVGPVLLALVGLWIARRHPRTGRSLACIALLALLALSLPPVADALLGTLEHHPPIAAERLARVQAIVVLGGGTYHAAPEYGGDTVSRWTLQRVRYAAWLQRRSQLPILVTAGAPSGGRPEAESMKAVIENELHGKVRWLEAASWDTAESAAYSAQILRAAGIARIALVSDAWHLPRAIQLFERRGLDVVAAPTGFATRPPSDLFAVLPSATALEASSQALRESLGILVQFLNSTITGWWSEAWHSESTRTPATRGATSSDTKTKSQQ